MVTSDVAVTVENMLEELARPPAAPFHEEQVSWCIQALLDQHKIPFSEDRYGNIIARYTRGSPHRSVALVAHMDHPAFEVVSRRGGRYQALVLGGGTALLPYLAAGTLLRLFTRDGVVPGRVLRVRAALEGDRPIVAIGAESPVEAGDWGVWEMPDFEVRGDFLHLRAVDDLGGCSLILATLAALRQRDAEADVYGVFTRAEEVGLLGAALVARGRAIPKSTAVISVEASRALPGAEQGAGPVIRVGDFRSTFQWNAEALLHAGATRLREATPDFKAQRQLMSGGTCEATAFSAFGYTTTGVALPLGNYHNMAEDHTLAPEFIHRRDLAGAAALLLATVEACQEPLEDPLRTRYGTVAPRVRRRLERTARPVPAILQRASYERVGEKDSPAAGS